MDKVYQLLSLKKVNLLTIDKLIIETEADAKFHLKNAFTDINSCLDAASELNRLVSLKNAKLLMHSNEYKIYEQEGKKLPYQDFKASLED